MQFVIFHGSYGSPDGNWFPQLQEQLEDLGQTVFAPKFPVEKWQDVIEKGKDYHSSIQTLQNWLEVFEREVLPQLKREEKLCFIGHSLGPVFILHCVDKFNIQLDSAIFVSPFLNTLGQWEFNAVNETFYKNNFNFEKLKKLIPLSYVLYSDNDPYVPQEEPKKFAEKLGSSLIPVRRAGHINSEVNLNEFPLVFNLCTTRLDLSLWQQYIAHRKETFGIDFFKDRPGSNILFKPDEIMDWQVFLYENLKKEGFCTFYSGRKSWDNKSKYFQDARKAAKRIESFTRVFLIEKLSDLRRPVLLEQIQLDLDAGINVFLCSLSDVVDKVPEIDFGIWDNKYLCVVKFDDEKMIDGLEINTREDDLQKANEWIATILKSSSQIFNIDEDITNFIKKSKEDVIFLTPEEVIDEGIFKFRHLRYEGFCTLYLAGINYWNTQSKYMQESRLAAKRVKNLIRVFIFESEQDFDNLATFKQIEEDLESGIRVYLCKKEDVSKQLHAEPDFGIWDNDYVCIVNFDEKNQATHARLSSLSADIEQATLWKEKILQEATPINNINDIKKLIK